MFTVNEIIDWFEERNTMFYKIGWIYLNSDQDILKVFHQTIIKVYDKIHTLKDNDHLEVTLIYTFIQTCKEHPRGERLNSSDDSLIDPIVLTYVGDLPLIEVAYILRLPIETVKSRLFQGIQLLRGTAKSQECCQYQGKFIGYLERTMNRAEKIQFEIHLHSCAHCQNELTAFQQEIFTLKNKLDTLEIPANLMESAKQQVLETVNQRNKLKKKRIKLSVTIASFLTFFIITGIATNTFSKIYYSWVDWREQESEEVRAFYKNGLGERLNMEVVSNGVRVKIKTAIADEFQTLVYYEVEDLKGRNQYMFSYEGASVKKDRQELGMFIFPNNFHNGGKNIYRGKASLEPMPTKSGTIELKFTKLMNADVITQNESYDQIDFIEGEWDFKIPVKKHPSFVHELEKEMEVDGIPVKLKKLTIAPTVTLLQYHFKLKEEGSYFLDAVNIEGIETKGKMAREEIYVWNRDDFYNGMNMLTTKAFEPLYYDNPKSLKLHFGSINLFYYDKRIVDIDASKGLPQVFEYKGSRVSIDEITVGDPTKIVMEFELTENRPYEQLSFQIGTDETNVIAANLVTESEGVYIDKNGKKSNNINHSVSLNESGQPRYYQTKKIIEITNDFSDINVNPTQLEIIGYSTTKYIDVIKEISLGKKSVGID